MIDIGAHLTIGPALEAGFYYDGYTGSRKITQEDFPKIEEVRALKKRQGKWGNKNCARPADSLGPLSLDLEVELCRWTKSIANSQRYRYFIKVQDSFNDESNPAKLKLRPFGKVMKMIAKEAHEFQRLVLSKEDALDMFADNPFKVQLITKKVRSAAKNQIASN